MKALTPQQISRLQNMFAAAQQAHIVKTASHWRVCQSIYKISVQRWKHYEQHPGRLKESLRLVDPAPETAPSGELLL